MDKGTIPAETMHKLVTSLVEEVASGGTGSRGETEQRLRDKMDEVLDAEEDYRSWKTNVPYLYSYVYSKVLEWPSLSIDWLPSCYPVEGHDGFVQQQFAIGTHTSEGESNSVILVDSIIPHVNKLPFEETTYSKIEGGVESVMFPGESQTRIVSKFRIAARIPHPGEANVIRHMPTKPNILATVGTAGDVLLLDSSKKEYANKVTPPLTGDLIDLDDVPSPSAQKEENSTDDTGAHTRLKGLKGEGWGLSWCSGRGHANRIAAVAECGSLCVWDGDTSGPSCDAIHRYSNVHDNPQDVAFSMFEADEIVVGTVGDDGILALWDLRQETPVAKVVASDHPLNSLSFSSRSSHLIAVGGNAKDVALYDCRKLNSCLHKMSGHEKTINRVSFNPHNSNIVASCSDDRRVKLWDVSRIGMEQAAADAEDGPPELLVNRHSSRFS
eukprot:GHVN01028843.1.p1 GENE.GHVN01028843.1~~GHVN01028843.1.p1  ORF type:complete len:440 (+),score=44.02 GHVN01028843.1:39-1358(+)